MDHSTRVTEAVAVTVLALSNGLGIERLAEPGAVPDDLLGHVLQALQPQVIESPVIESPALDAPPSP